MIPVGDEREPIGLSRVLLAYRATGVSFLLAADERGQRWLRSSRHKRRGASRAELSLPSFASDSCELAGEYAADKIDR